MREPVIKLIMDHLKEDHFKATESYIEASRKLDSRLKAFKPQLTRKAFYCIVKHPSRRYQHNKLLKQDSLDLSDKQPEFDSRIC